MHHKTCYKSGGTLGIDPAANYDEQLALYQAGAVDVLWQFMGIPSPAIQAARAQAPQSFGTASRAYSYFHAKGLLLAMVGQTSSDAREPDMILEQDYNRT